MKLNPSRYSGDSDLSHLISAEFVTNSYRNNGKLISPPPTLRRGGIKKNININKFININKLANNKHKQINKHQK